MHHKTIGVTASLLSIQRSDTKLQGMCASHKVTKQKEQDGDSFYQLPLISVVCENVSDRMILPQEGFSCDYDLVWTPPHLRPPDSQCRNLDESHSTLY